MIWILPQQITQKNNIKKAAFLGTGTSGMITCGMQHIYYNTQWIKL